MILLILFIPPTKQTSPSGDILCVVGSYSELAKFIDLTGSPRQCFLYTFSPSLKRLSRIIAFRAKSALSTSIYPSSSSKGDDSFHSTTDMELSDHISFAHSLSEDESAYDHEFIIWDIDGHINACATGFFEKFPENRS